MERLVVLISMLLYFTSIALAADCPQAWTKNSNFCYKFVVRSFSVRGKTWENAENTCQSFGGHLTSITNQSEQTFIASQIKQYKNEQFWIGYNDRNNESNFVWTDGSNSSSYTNWNWGEPNNYHDEDCVELTYLNGRWNDDACKKEYSFICKTVAGKPIPTLPSVPPPTTTAPLYCDVGWKQYGNSCYKFSTVQRKWVEAKTDCHQSGGYLVKIDGADEQYYLTYALTSIKGDFWIGLSDRAVEGLYIWEGTNTVAKNFTHWNNGEPNDHAGNEDCIGMYSGISAGYWNDDFCDNQKQYICEQPDGQNLCPVNWVPFKNSCYQFNVHPSQSVTWQQARNSCVAVQGSDLVSILSSDEQLFLIKQANDLKSSNIWIGLNDRASSGVYVWSDRSPYKYKNWGRYEPRSGCSQMIVNSQNGTWGTYWCSSKNPYICKIPRASKTCDSPFGLANYLVGDSQITASSSKNSNSQPNQARLNLQPTGSLTGSWCTANNKKGEYLQIDLGLVRRISHIALQGKPKSKDFVKTFYVRYGNDGKTFVTFGETKNQSYKVFKGNANADDIQNVMLGETISGRFIRIYPLDWSNNICLRTEIYGCEGQAASARCGVGWEEGSDDTCYQYNTDRLKIWADARASCTSQGGDLLSIVTNNERIYIDNRMKSLASSVNSFWIGLNDRESSKLFSWSDQSPYLLTRWDAGYPNDNNNSKSCVELVPSRAAWRDVNCGEYKPYVCEFQLKVSLGKPKYSRTANWISTTDLYWPIDSVQSNEVLGSTTGKANRNILQSSLLQNNKKTLQFSGPNAFITCGDFSGQCISDAEDCTYGISVSLVVRFDKDAAAWTTKTFLLDSINDDTFLTSRGFSLYVENGQVNVVVQTMQKKWSLSKSLRAGIWQHVVVTWKGSGLKLYLNGVQSASSYSGSFQKRNTNNPSLTIGSRSTQSQGNVKGNYYMRSLAVWYRLLSDAEIKGIYNAEFGNCKFGWKEFGQYCYQFNYDKKSWQDARLQCQQRGGELVSINSPVEQAHVSLEAGEYGFATYAWIGFHDKSIESAWEWSDGTTPRFSNWYNLQPDNWVDAEDCGHTYSQWWALGRWNDITCDTAMPYICKAKKAYVPTGGVSPTTAPKNKTICEFTTDFISCPTHTILSVTSAQYGRTSSSMCGWHTSVTNCRLDVSSKVQSMCNGRSYCTLRPSNALFGKDPCLNIVKYLAVNYTCNKGLVSTPGCPAGWQRSPDGNTCYGLMLDKKNWIDARASCKKNGAELVSIHSGWESTLVTSLLVMSWDAGDIWIGLTDRGQRGVYRWSDGSAVDFTHWLSGEPNDRDPQGGCVRATMMIESRDWVYWVDVDCSYNLAYVCKKFRSNFVPSTKGPTTLPLGSCPSGWIAYRFGCYKAFMQQQTWTSARDACRKFTKTDLVSIHGTAENTFVQTLTNSTFDAWIGLNDRGTISGHVWSDRSAVQFTYWGPDQPDSHSGQQPCVVVKSTAGWYDVGCYATRPYICKMAKPPLTTTRLPTTTPMPTTPIPGICDPGWMYWNQLCYHFSNESLSNQRSWFDARALCRKARGDLVSLRDAAENHFVFSEVQKRYSKWVVWIGLSDLGKEGVYSWSDDTPLSYINYGSNEPNDWKGIEDCIEMRRYDGKWNDQNCGLKQPFVCRKHNTTVTPPFTLIPPTPGPAVGQCDPGWVNYDQSCYKFVFFQLQNWANAQSVCQASTNGNFSGNLVSINNVYEQAFLSTTIKDHQASLWIGLSDHHIENTFMWADNSPVTYVNWEKGSPSYQYYKDCVDMTTQKVALGRWDVQPCTNFHGYICEAAALPLGPTPVTPTPSGDCPAPFTKFADSCFMVSYTKSTWDEANQKCKSYGADLASIHSTVEQAYLVRNMVNFKGDIWTGLTRQPNALAFTWSDQSIQVYTHWSRGQPGQPGSQRTCVQARSSDGRWTEVDCGLKNGFMCKISKGEPQVTPSLLGQCLPGWTRFEKYCYRFETNQQLTWAQARLVCSRQGGDLVSVMSLEELDFVIYQVEDSAVTSFWIGLNDRNIEGGYQWSDGSPTTFVQWHSKEPNDPNGVENCVEMAARSGDFNDLYCSQRRAYACKSQLECSSALGMSGGNITNAQITVSNSIDANHGAANARLNSSSAWCANASIPNNYLQVDLLSQTRVSKISIQGTSAGVPSPSFIKSFTITYANYEKQWLSYIRSDGSLLIIPGNNDASSVVTAALDPPIDARYFRIVPQSWVNGICAKVELYGCAFECQRPMLMKSSRIKDGQITASSSTDGHEAAEARPVNRGWCPAATDKSPWIQVNIPSIEKRITQMMTWGAGTGGPGYVTKYKLAYSDDGDTWVDYTEKGVVRIFRGNSDLNSPMKHILGEPIDTHNLRIKPLTGKSMCLRFEIFGCANGCLDPLGMEKGAIANSWITASSFLDDTRKPSMGRLNDPQGWCAATNDREQFLSIDLNRDMRVRRISTQGSADGYVTSFTLSLKRDDYPWRTFREDGSIMIFTGNSDGTTVVSTTLIKVIRGRYFRFNILKWSKRICLRVELYGCLPYVQPTTIPSGSPPTKPPEVIYKVSIKLTKVEWVDDYTKPSSSTFRTLADHVTSAVNNVYATSKYFSEATVTGFRRGSVIVDLKLIFVGTSQSSNLIDALKTAVKSGRVGDLQVDPNSFNATVIDGGKVKPQSGGRSSGLSTGGKAAITVVFVLIALAAAAGGAWYFSKKRRAQFVFKKQTFDNPIHFSSKAYDMES